MKYVFGIIGIIILLVLGFWGYNKYKEKKYDDCYWTCFHNMGCGFGIDCTKNEGFLDCKNNCLNKYQL